MGGACLAVSILFWRDAHVFFRCSTIAPGHGDNRTCDTNRNFIRSRELERKVQRGVEMRAKERRWEKRGKRKTEERRGEER